MEELMRAAEFPEDAIEETLAAERRLKNDGNWERVSNMAQKIMKELPDSEKLGEMMAEAAGWSKETEIHGYMLDMLVLLQCWKILKERYEEKNLPMQLFWDSLMDMKYKLMECRKLYGVYGNFVGFWYDRFFDLSRFALGRLQFETETYPYEEPFTQNGKTVRKGDVVINMHIPSSGPLTASEVDDALLRAAEFYKDEFADGKTAFVVLSWLLDPDLVKLLPDGNTKAFAQRFTVVDVHKMDEFHDGWRVFGSEWDPKLHNLPRRTKLQTSIADYLQQGGKLGEGYAIFVR
jgi:hypothetical protein